MKFKNFDQFMLFLNTFSAKQCSKKDKIKCKKCWFKSRVFRKFSEKFCVPYLGHEARVDLFETDVKFKSSLSQ